MFDKCPNCLTLMKEVIYYKFPDENEIHETLICSVCHTTKDYTLDFIKKYMINVVQESDDSENEEKGVINVNNYNYVTNVYAKNEENNSKVEFVRPKNIHLDFSNIYGLDDYKEYIRIILNQKYTDKMIHILIDGDPSTCKTYFLEQIKEKSNIGKYCRFVNGSSLTGSGFYDVLDSFRYGYLLIDEVDKLEKIHQPVFLGVLENNRVVSDKSDKHINYAVNLQVIATSNDSDKLIEPLRSRFNEIYINQYNRQEKHYIGKRIMIDRYNMNPELAEYTINKFLDAMPDLYIRQIRDFCLIGYTQKEEIDNYINLIKRLNNEQNNKIN